jgi:hypothetical protein
MLKRIIGSFVSRHGRLFIPKSSLQGNADRNRNEKSSGIVDFDFVIVTSYYIELCHLLSCRAITKAMTAAH